MIQSKSKNKIFYTQDYIVIDNLYSIDFLKKIEPFLMSLEFELFKPPYLTDSHMYRLINNRILYKIRLLLLNKDFDDLLYEVFQKNVSTESIRLTKYTANNQDHLSFHSDYDDIRIAGFSIDLTFNNNCDSKFEIKNCKTNQIILSNKAGHAGRVTFFRIDKHLSHRVTPTFNKDRLAMTGWIK
jgi:hypothetical protein